MAIKIGIIGNGKMIQGDHLPFLQERIASKRDVDITWVTGCLCTSKEYLNCRFCKSVEVNGTFFGPYKERKPMEEEEWKHLYTENKVDAVIISLPNYMHYAPIKYFLSNKVSVAVDKPPTISADNCESMVQLAEQNNVVFMTMSQRRYEDVYQKVFELIANESVGEPVLITYLIAHEYFDRGQGMWPSSKMKSGGGALIASGFHGIDTVMWLLKQCPSGPVVAKSVSARTVKDTTADLLSDAVETVADVRIMLSNGGIFNAISSYEAPKGSLDENIKIYGTNGTIRLMRDRFVMIDRSAARLSYQDAQGNYEEFDTSNWYAKRYAPFEDFINVVVSRATPDVNPVLPQSPALDSIQTMKIIDAAYKSASQNGKEIAL